MSEQEGSSLEEIVRIVEQQFQKNVKQKHLCKEEEEGVINIQSYFKVKQPQVQQSDKMQCQTEFGLQNQYDSFLPLKRPQSKEQNGHNQSEKLKQKLDIVDEQQRRPQQSVQEKRQTKNNGEGQLQIELSVEDSQSEDEGDSNEYSMGKGKNKSKKTKRIKKKVIKNTSGLDEDNILLERKRKRNYGGTYNEVEPKQLRRHKKIEYDNILKDTTRNHHLQNMVVKKIVYSVFNGQSRYYLVELANQQQVSISQNHMRVYFPRKLGQFYERLLNRLAISQQSVQ